MIVLCELSGGADSALAAIYAKKKYPKATFWSVFVDYGQRYAKHEEQASFKIHKKLGWDLGNWQGIAIRNLFGRDSKEGMVEEYFPLRNLVLTAVACSLADSIGAEALINGSKSQVLIEDDPYSFKDSLVPFYAMLEGVVNYAKEIGHLSIEPLLALNRLEKMTKEQVYRELKENGFELLDTFSCFHPVGKNECGVCRNCLEKKRMIELELASVGGSNVVKEKTG